VNTDLILSVNTKPTLYIALILSGSLVGCIKPDAPTTSKNRLQTAPKNEQIRISIKPIEVGENDPRALGFDWHRANPQDPCKAVITALNEADWNTLQKLAPAHGNASRSIENWKQRPVTVGKLIETWENHVFKEGEKPCTVYSFALSNKDGSHNPHWLQIVVRKRPDGQVELVDFWKLGW
jgi:hypothetical protein